GATRANRSSPRPGTRSREPNRSAQADRRSRDLVAEGLEERERVGGVAAGRRVEITRGPRVRLLGRLLGRVLRGVVRRLLARVLRGGRAGIRGRRRGLAR